MASKNSKNKSQSKKVSDVSDSVIDEIMDMEPKKKEKTEAPVVEVETLVVEEKTEEAAPIEETTPTEAVEENLEEKTETITPDVTVTETVLSAPVADVEGDAELVVPTVENGPVPPVENPDDFFKDNEKKPAEEPVKEEPVAEAKEENTTAPKPSRRRRTTREVYGYDVSGYNYDL